MARGYSATAPTYDTFQDVPVYEQNYLRDLVHQWNQLAGYTVDIPDWALAAMANQQINNLAGVGQFMWDHLYDNGRDPGAYFVPPQAVYQTPWAHWGLTKDDFHSQQQSYEQLMMSLTGNKGSWDDLQWHLSTNNGRINFGLLREQMMQNKDVQNVYGWLKYGLDYDQFQQQKLQWKTAFGKELSNEEGVTQLQYAHQAASAPHTAEQRPTLGQVEKRQANVGAAQSEVR